MLRVTTAAFAVLLCTACDGGGAKAKPEGAAAAKPDPAPAAAKAEEPASSEPPPAADGDPLGARFQDPPWFRKEMFGDQAKFVDFARSEANEAGLFKSHVIFELPEGTTTDKCVEMVTGKLEGAVELTVEDQPNDRKQLKGTTERYDVTAMCGDAEGKMKAYIAYEWTR
ncbi:MAG: hypothetical protein ACRBN8_05530 [Nannocystales bacterium]